MSIDYNIKVAKLKENLPFVNYIFIVNGKNEFLYVSKEIDDKEEIQELLSCWSSLKRQKFAFYGLDYVTRSCNYERFIASSVSDTGHIVGVRLDDVIMVALIEPDGIIPFTTVEMIKTIATFKTKPYDLNDNIQLEKNKKKFSSINSASKAMEGVQIGAKETEISFTARLMAYYRAQENERDSPLIHDPFAKDLAGDLTNYLKDHIRISEMDYPIVRSYFIEENLLKSWCDLKKQSQIVILGAGLDTRAYRFKPFSINEHTVFEIDFPLLFLYKEEKLKKFKPLCKLKRLPLDLSASNWVDKLIKAGFSRGIPTFWILEGLVYYMEQKDIQNLLKHISLISMEGSQIFADLMHSSRWFPFFGSKYSTDPYSRHIKWGININQVESFFETSGWNVTFSWADDHDQGRNVGQKAMIFTHGTKI